MSCRLLVYSLLAVAALVAPNQGATTEFDIAVCTECHGVDGMGKSDPMVPVIAGMPVAHIEEAIYAYVDGARQCVEVPRMCETVSELSEDQVTDAAVYFARQYRVATSASFDKDLAARGAVLHERHCASCHKPPHDEDVADAIGIPLHGQHADYVRFAIRAYFTGNREPLLETMAHELQQLEAEDLDALVNYYSSYRVAE